MDYEPKMPRRVLRLAQKWGVHMDCVVANDPCAQCCRIVTKAFEHFYGDEHDEGAVVIAIVRDFVRDIKEEQS